MAAAAGDVGDLDGPQGRRGHGHHQDLHLGRVRALAVLGHDLVDAGVAAEGAAHDQVRVVVARLEVVALVRLEVEIDR